MLTSIQQQQIEDKFYELLEQARELYGVTLPNPKVTYRLRGYAAAKAHSRLNHTSQSLVRIELKINPYLSVQDFNDALIDTIPHEVAHFVQAELYYAKGIKVQSHGPEWKRIAKALGVPDPDKYTHNLDITETPAYQSRIDYVCGCEGKIHKISVRRHNQIQLGKSKRQCRLCRQTIYKKGTAGPLQIAEIHANFQKHIKQKTEEKQIRAETIKPPRRGSKAEKVFILYKEMRLDEAGNETILRTIASVVFDGDVGKARAYLPNAEARFNAGM